MRVITVNHFDDSEELKTHDITKPDEFLVHVDAADFMSPHINKLQWNFDYDI